jgi:hypothetical protein
MIREATQLHFIRQTLYDLKSRYPTEVDIYQYVTNCTDPKTGIRTTTKKVINVRKAILLPTSLTRSFIFRRDYMTANKQFTFGGLFDIDTRVLIIDADDIDVKIEKDNYIVIRDKKYEIKAIEENEGLSYLLTIKETIGALPYCVVTIAVNHTLQLFQRVVNGP